MRRELVVRLRVSRPAARALLAALLLGCPCGDLSPATREFKLTGYAPSGRRAYGMLRADGTADLASEGGNVLMLRGVKGETCGFSPVGKNLHVRNEEVQVFPGTEPGKVLIPNGRCYRDQGSGLGTRARRVEINGPELAAGAPDGKSPYATLYVR
ncbi:MAG: hypothetical protein HY554_04045, partial [Elusimicrobia bacterium]|nr:hypothetical protein [Elusimicrobiota bacterium]